MAIAIDNMIEEIKKPVDSEVNGSARKAELQSIKQTAIDCKELIIERQKLEQMVKELKENGQIEEDKDYSGGFAERFSKVIGCLKSPLNSIVTSLTQSGSERQRMKNWASTEDQDNKRMNVIGSNGNDGQHYDWNGEYED